MSSIVVEHQRPFFYGLTNEVLDRNLGKREWLCRVPSMSAPRVLILTSDSFLFESHPLPNRCITPLLVQILHHERVVPMFYCAVAGLGLRVRRLPTG